MKFLRRSAGTLVATAVALGVVTLPAHANNGSKVPLPRAGTLTSWGPDTPAERAVPASLHGRAVTAIAATAKLNLALTGDGTVVEWGQRADAYPVPAGLDHVTAIAAGSTNMIALRSDHTIVVWGDDDHGVTDIPAGVQGHVVDVDTAQWTAAAVLDDGSVVTWGSSSYTTGVWKAPDLDDAVAVAAGANLDPFLALTAEGDVISWGAPDRPAKDSGQWTVPTTLGKAVAIASGGGTGTAGAITETGQVVLWGALLAKASTYPMPAELSGTEPADPAVDLQFSGAYGQAMVLTQAGNVYSWGGPNGNPTVNAAMNTVPDAVQGHVTAIATGGSAEFALTPAFAVGARPAIGGTPRIGATLTATDATFSGGTAPTITSQWKLSTGAVVGTGRTLAVTAAMAGKRITLTQTATLDTGADAQTLTTTSASVGPVPSPNTGGPKPHQVIKTNATIGKVVLKPKKLTKHKLKKAKAKVRVTTTGHVPTGTITIKLKSKTVTATLTNGKAKLKLKKLAKKAKKGKNKLTISYSGDSTTNPATAKAKLKLK